MDNPQTVNDITSIMYTVGYLAGYLDGLSFMQDVQYNAMFPKNMMSEKEREKFSKEMNFHRLNIPEGGLATGQLMLIYKKYAEKHPEKLNGTARICVFESLVEAYGWK
jgi:hypothetical protein